MTSVSSSRLFCSAGRPAQNFSLVAANFSMHRLKYLCTATPGQDMILVMSKSLS